MCSVKLGMWLWIQYMCISKRQYGEVPFDLCHWSQFQFKCSYSSLAGRLLVLFSRAHNWCELVENPLFFSWGHYSNFCTFLKSFQICHCMKKTMIFFVIWCARLPRPKYFTFRLFHVVINFLWWSFASHLCCQFFFLLLLLDPS